MENQEEKKPQPVKHPEEANTGEETRQEQNADHSKGSLQITHRM